jgi:hypothetical protein
MKDVLEVYYLLNNVQEVELRRQLILRAQCCVINADPGEII